MKQATSPTPLSQLRRLRPMIAFALVLLLNLPALDAFAAEPQIKPFHKDSMQQIASAQDGKPYWLVLWDLDCPYCVQSMINLAAAQKKDPKLSVVTISTDAIQTDKPENKMANKAAHKALRKRLSETGLRSSAYVFADDSKDALRYAIDPTWRGEKPRSYYYSGQGSRKIFSGVLTTAEITGQ